METLGERLKRLREERGLSANRLGALAGIGEGAVFKLESGATKQPEFVTGAKLARALGVSADVLAGIEREGLTELEGPDALAAIEGLTIAVASTLDALASVEALPRPVQGQLRQIRQRLQSGGAG